MKLSIIIPVYNEVNTILKIIERVKRINISLEKEIIIIDDASNDGTKETLEQLKDPQIEIFYHTANQGKGAAIKTAQEHLTGEVVIIQDADLEYQPDDYPNMIKPILDGFADVVYGSRFLGPHRVFMFWHYCANKFLTLLTNILYNTVLSDMETGFKAFKTDVFKDINIKSRRFNFEPEITAKVFKQGLKVVEIPITYYGRSYQEGKKIDWPDAIAAIWALLKYRLLD
ncbi:glycosyltransferase family 2 protein [Planctomycetota bacterium]